MSETVQYVFLIHFAGHVFEFRYTILKTDLFPKKTQHEMNVNIKKMVNSVPNLPVKTKKP